MISLLVNSRMAFLALNKKYANCKCVPKDVCHNCKTCHAHGTTSSSVASVLQFLRLVLDNLLTSMSPALVLKLNVSSVVNPGSLKGS